MMRLDVYVSSHELLTTRAKAQDAIQEGRVQVNGRVITKNSFPVEEGMDIRVQEQELNLASRAGFKLYDVLEDFQVNLKGRICIDVGASTGGFSDVCLRQGATLVYAVDVGKDQLLDSLRKHPRLINMENCNCRYLTKEMFSSAPDFACMDVSFISIKQILPSLCAIMKQKEMVVLVKPQFEAGKGNVGKNGVVKDEKIHIHVLRDMIAFVESLGLYVHHVQASSILGRSGNKEFIIHIMETPCQKVFPLKEIVKEYKVKR